MEMYKQLPINIREVSMVGPLQFYSTQVLLFMGRGVLLHFDPGGALRVSGEVGEMCRHCRVSSRISSRSFSVENRKMSSMF